ncbi:hypothetical protein DNTS_015238 [Danionella cerebrum]|uniref:Complexin-4 n=1 Tax=Danionella cerebrum TaxID=2873325 RepID=A0A553MSE3_9TELE|nr:hypothetical protein DNTS_015238 [Danionella translucida]
MFGGQLKDLTGGLGEEKPEGEKSEAAAKGMTQEEFEQYQQQLAEENELDDTQIQAAADDVELPTELAKMIAEDNQEEEQKQSVLGQLADIQNMDVDQLKEKAQNTLEELRQSAEKCDVM